MVVAIGAEAGTGGATSKVRTCNTVCYVLHMAIKKSTLYDFSFAKADSIICYVVDVYTHRKNVGKVHKVNSTQDIVLGNLLLISD